MGFIHGLIPVWLILFAWKEGVVVVVVVVVAVL